MSALSDDEEERRDPNIKNEHVQEEDPNSKEVIIEKEHEEKEYSIPSSQKAKLRGPIFTFDYYLGGGAIGFSLTMLLMVSFEWIFERAGIEMSVPLLVFLSFAPSVLGSAVAAFLFTRKSRKYNLSEGVKLGISGLIITFIYTILLRTRLGGIYLMIGFLVGGSLGGFIAKKSV